MRIFRSSRDKCHTWTVIASTLHRPVSHRATDENRVAFASGSHARQTDVSVVRVRGQIWARRLLGQKRPPRAGSRVERIYLRQCRVCRVQFCNKRGVQQRWNHKWARGPRSCRGSRLTHKCPEAVDCAGRQLLSRAGHGFNLKLSGM